jgi:hypothetical protein
LLITLFHIKLFFIRGKYFAENEVIDDVVSIPGTGLFLNILIISHKTMMLFLSDCELSNDPYQVLIQMDSAEKHNYLLESRCKQIS